MNRILRQVSRAGATAVALISIANRALGAATPTSTSSRPVALSGSRTREHLCHLRCGRAVERPLSDLPDRPRNPRLHPTGPRRERRRGPLDHFKEFNDRHGHPSGDEALRTFAGILRSCLRDDDIAARYGGEEFAVVLPGIDEATALAVAERIRSRTDSTLISLAPGITDRVTVSIGIACAPEQALDRITLLRLADEALYRAKQAGRNRVAYAGMPDAPVGPAPMIPAPVKRRAAKPA